MFCCPAVLEDRLSRQQAENEVERGRLQSLIAKLEAHMAQQSRQIEQVRNDVLVQNVSSELPAHAGCVWEDVLLHTLHLTPLNRSSSGQHRECRR